MYIREIFVKRYGYSILLIVNIFFFWLYLVKAYILK